MRTSWIISFAALCGTAVFIYTLATGTIRRAPWMQTPTVAPSGNMQLNDASETIEELEALIAREPQGRRVAGGFSHFRLAQRYTEAGRLEDARAAWEEAARRRLAAAQANPDRESFWFEAGWALWKLGRMDEATPALMEAERLASLPHPNQRREDQWFRLGWSRKLLGFDQDAAFAFSRAMDFLPASIPDWDAETHYKHARYLALLGDSEGALAALERAVDAGFDRPGVAASSDDLASIRNHPRFPGAVERMRNAPRRYDLGPG